MNNSRLQQISQECVDCDRRIAEIAIKTMRENGLKASLKTLSDAIMDNQIPSVTLAVREYCDLKGQIQKLMAEADSIRTNESRILQ